MREAYPKSAPTSDREAVRRDSPTLLDYSWGVANPDFLPVHPAVGAILPGHRKWDGCAARLLLCSCSTLIPGAPGRQSPVGSDENRPVRAGLPAGPPPARTKKKHDDKESQTMTLAERFWQLSRED